LIEPKVPSTEWLLSPKGRVRAQAFADREVLPRDARIIASTELKTMETASILARGRPFETSDGLRENIRTATGYVAPDEFDRLFHALFTRPDESAGGWETAIATQQRVVAAVEALVNPSLTTIFVGHGTAGTVLKCAVAGRPISRAEEQREMAWPGGGNVFAFDWARRTLVRDWQSFEDFDPIAE
jgi:broad specificity phosphatase PhoE